MGYESEAALEAKLIETLSKNGYEKVTISDEESLVNNLRKQLNIHNKDKLNGTELTNDEFNRLMITISDLSVFESAKVLRNTQSIERDNGEIIYLSLFNVRDWCKNQFQVTNQVTIKGKYKNRYDVTLLINGLPLVQIELKRRGGDINEAFHQITRYREHSYKQSKLFRFIQFFVISNGTDTKYLCNSDDRELSLNFAFNWTDESNIYINQLLEFATFFLERCNVGKMIARYTVLHEKNRQLMIMRPYQVYAVEALIHRAMETKNNGFIWHTTGSGKTLTSFKAAQIISNLEEVEKVFFLIDRKDLDDQTTAEFNAFSKGSVDQTESTSHLFGQLKDDSKKIIVTTIQKMNNAIKRYSKYFEDYQEKKVVFIIDECHRSQFGEMHLNIQKFFSNAQYFGFTGTPIFGENKGADGRITEHLFEKCLHTYLIHDAIKDHNVLPFNVEYYSTFNSKDEIQDDLIESIDKDELYESSERIEKIVKKIISHHDAITHNRDMNALMTVKSGVSGVPLLNKYYQEFKKQNKEIANSLKVAAIFSFGANEPLEEVDGNMEHHRDMLEKMIDDYNELFDDNFSTDNFEGYFKSICNRFRNGEIDILLVVNMFLTGFDSKRLNTLYVDRNLQYHGLIQAFSRTNRVYNNVKTQGNIIGFDIKKENVDEALKLFSKNHENDIIMPKLEELATLMNKLLIELFAITPDVNSVDRLESDEDKIRFLKKFREIMKLMIRLKTYIEFGFSLINITEQEFEDFIGKYLALREPPQNSNKTSVIEDFNFEVELIARDKIGRDYILNLIYQLPMDDEKEREKKIDEIIKDMEITTDERLRSKKDLIMEFLNSVLPGLGFDDNIRYEYGKYEDEKQLEELESVAITYEMPLERVKYYVEEKVFNNYYNTDELNKDIKGKLIEKSEKKQNFIETINDIIERFD